MDINQAAKMIEWLDEERRRDKATIATLEERLSQQQEVIETLQRRMGGLESDQTVMRNQFVPSERENDIIDAIRKEMRGLIESAESKRLTAEREAERRADLARENLQRVVRENTEKIAKLEKQLSDFAGIELERDRLSSAVTDLQQRVDNLFKKFDEPERRLAYLEEQRRQDARHISEVETDIPELRKQIDSVRPKIQLLEELALRNERRVQEVQNSERERREQIQQFIDQQNLLLQQRDQQIETLINRFGEHDSIMQQNTERFEAWAETHRAMNKIVQDFNRIGERLERRISEVAETQRFSEERFRQEWNAWSADEQKRWKQFNISNDETWRIHDKDFAKFAQHIDEIQRALQPLQESINRLWNLERARAQLYRDRYQALLLEYDTGSNLNAVPAPPPDNGSNGAL